MSEGSLILVSGSSGRIGSAVIERLARRHRVVGIDLVEPPDRVSGVDYQSIDLTSDESVRATFARIHERHGSRMASMLHLAAYYDFSGEDSPKYEQVTVQGTRRVLEALQRFDVEQFLFSSSMLVHAPVEPGQRISEEAPLDPRWAYPASKMAAERLLRRDSHGMSVAVLRIAGVYDDLCHSIPLAHQIQRIYERRLTSRIFPGHLAHGQSFLHMDDLVDAVERIVDRQQTLPAETVFLLGEPEAPSYDELQHTLGRLIHDEEWITREIPKAIAKAGAWAEELTPGNAFIKPWMIDFAGDHYALDISRARALLGWEPTRSLPATLPRIVAALKDDPEAWYRENDLGRPKPAGG